MLFNTVLNNLIAISHIVFLAFTVKSPQSKTAAKTTTNMPVRHPSMQCICRTYTDGVHLNDFNDVYAFTLNCIRLYGTGKIELTFEFAINNPSHIMYVKVLFRWQKNNNHGISYWCARNDKLTYLCPIRKWVNILRRFIQLRRISCRDQPLAIYQK